MMANHHLLALKHVSFDLPARAVVINFSPRPQQFVTGHDGVLFAFQGFCILFQLQRKSFPLLLYYPQVFSSLKLDSGE